MTLKELMQEAVTKDGIKFMPDRYENIYFNWINNLRDWCISRQIWYGHRIPVWYKGDETFVGVEAPEGAGWIQDEDTLDTWFSSGLWTFSTLGWPEETPDLKMYHPTDVLETGYDLIFFWVARMILMSKFLMGEIPFKTVYMHGLVRNEKGEKISKSLGGNVDPLEITTKWGTDATRMALIVGVGPGADSKLSDEKLVANKKFANKLWNITRYVMSQEGLGEIKPDLKKEFDDLVAEVTTEMDEYKFYIVAEKIYHYVWHRFADEIIEESKTKPEYAPTLRYILENSLKLLHPFMPFITEEIWQTINKDAGKSMLMIEEWPV
jgi:valyl-tRNA synthetase